MEKILTDKNFDEELKNIGEGSPMLVDFWAPWCAPCRMQLPIVEKMAEEGYHVGKVNIDEQMGLAGRFGVMSIPTLIVFKDGKEQQRFVGVQSRQVLEDAMNEETGHRIPAAAREKCIRLHRKGWKWPEKA